MTGVPAMPPVTPRVQALIGQMTLEEKVSQLVSFWVDQPGDGVAPMQEEMVTEDPYDLASARGLGHLTRVYGTTPVDPVERARWLEEKQQELRERSGHGIGAIVHEECLTGLAAWQATAFPSPLAWGATFDPELIRKMASLIGRDMAKLGIHQGLAPVLDVVRDPRWGRTEEAISEDPYLVGTIGLAYIQGLQSAGVDATLKHFVGYSNSRAGRNHAPVHAGPREIADVFLPPFEMAVIEGDVRSVMNSYSEIDGVPVGADPRLLTDLLHVEWGFEGTVVADYYAVAFLALMQQIAADRQEAAQKALIAGIDVELPAADAYPKIVDAIRAGQFPEDYVNRALGRVLSQKERHGLLDPPTWKAPEQIDLDSAENRQVALEVAEESLVLLSNDGVLPLANPATIALVGPNGNSYEPLMGCYSFVNHVLAHHPGVDTMVAIPTLFEALTDEFPDSALTYAEGCPVEDPEQGTDDGEIERTVAEAASADIIVVAVGDRAGLFGRGTVGEGNDVESLDLPGSQRRLVQALVATGKPVVMVLLTGRPYAIEWAFDGQFAPAAVLQAFFPGEEGSVAIARVLSGRSAPSGRLPVSLPRSAGAQPYSYLHPFLGGATDVTSVDPAPVKPFGFGLGYTTFEHSNLRTDDSVDSAGTFVAEVTVKNTGDQAGVDVVQLYGHDLVGSVTRPVAQLLAYHRLRLEPGQEKTVRFTVPTTRLSFTGLDMIRIVEPGAVELWVGPSCEEKETTAQINIVGSVYNVKLSDQRRAEAIVL